MLKRAPSYEVKIAAHESAQVKTYAMSGFAETPSRYEQAEAAGRTLVEDAGIIAMRLIRPGEMRQLKRAARRKIAPEDFRSHPVILEENEITVQQLS
jgi:hypothetical protein